MTLKPDTETEGKSSLCVYLILILALMMDLDNEDT